ncbi:hypothetical protein CONPUDRAFT_77494 [Coniophora puteana RWD-64-598 SS2]|uniref:CoA-dependent acyltransferase n=1 Tax=Coniophora puteana (strain RWD-64-598) TaxID=741705 RepID=A0A5M3M880_CONPW|nr:uncharacterized protein CONPUDRAFT_77494 [Coniophora puteana RWD-64-598 SS2]EIW75253.1 hypothetical protein CONPUDRAFT_77494 [Coniophora puteana RWD-64-598 SS2]
MPSFSFTDASGSAGPSPALTTTSMSSEVPPCPSSKADLEVASTPASGFDYSRFSWRQPCPDAPGYFEREAFAAEMILDTWHRFAHGEQTLFLGVDLSLPSSPSHTLSAAEFIDAVRSAWSALRFDVPTVASHTSYTCDTVHPLVTYQSAASASDVATWAKRTVRGRGDIRGLETVRTLDELRYEVAKRTIPEITGDQTFIYVLDKPSSPSQGGKDRSAEYGLLLHTSHVPFDGAGTKILMTLLLRHLAAVLDGRCDPEAWRSLAWGEEGANLLPSVPDSLGPTEEKSGPVYEETLKETMKDYAEWFPRMYGFKPRNIGPGPSNRIWRTFSKEKTSQLVRASRAQGFTLNQLAHAAVYVVCSNDNPIPIDSNGAFVNFGLRNSRSTLAPPYNTADGYPGFCLGISVVAVPCSVFVELSDEPLLFRVARRVKQGYVKMKELPSLTAVAGEQMEMVMRPAKEGQELPPPAMGPWFSGDGIGEDYLQPVYRGAQGAEVIRVEDFFTSLNKQDPGPFFRCFTWNGHLQLSVDYNEYAMPTPLMQSWLDEWVGHLEGILPADNSMPGECTMANETILPTQNPNSLSIRSLTRKISSLFKRDS